MRIGALKEEQSKCSNFENNEYQEVAVFNYEFEQVLHLARLSYEEGVVFNVFEGNACTSCHGAKRVFGNVEGDGNLVG